MLTEDYVSFETAKLLKEKEFDGKCYKVWVHYTSSTPMLWAAPNFVEGETIVDRESVESAERTWNMIYCDPENKYHGYLAPTLQMAMKWLREVHHWHIFVIPRWEDVEYMPGEWEEKMVGYQYVIVNIGEVARRNEQPITTALSTESACEAAIKYCLENLV